jgi:hypothetical protein
MLAGLNSGDDILAAAQWSKGACASGWNRRRLRQVIRRISAGESWVAAWTYSFRGTPLDDWLLRNAAARECPAEGFALLEENAAAAIRRGHRALLHWTPVATTLGFGVLVALVGWGVIGWMVQLIEFAGAA